MGVVVVLNFYEDLDEQDNFPRRYSIRNDRKYEDEDLEQRRDCARVLVTVLRREVDGGWSNS